jgi:rfaE bifunctional protein nucleotidyltransferase chain/domain
MPWHPRQKHFEWQALLAWREQARVAGEVVVWTNGTFDLLHAGHLSSLHRARALGDRLVVGLNSDRSVRAYKGPHRPIIAAVHRAELMAALECVDAVWVFDEDTPTVVLAQLQPDIHVKGAEYAPPNGKPVPERAIVEGYGGRIAFLPMVVGLSTTAVLKRIMSLPAEPEA